MKKLLFPYAALVATLIYLVDLILVFIRRPDLILTYLLSPRGALFLFMIIASYIFYFLAKYPTKWIQNRGAFLKILLQILFLFVILFSPLAWYDIFSGKWFAGLSSIFFGVFGFPLCLILAVIAYYLQKNQEGITGRIKFLNIFQIVLSIVLVIFFGIGLANGLAPLEQWRNYQPIESIRTK